jgi:hypothetical protein
VRARVKTLSGFAFYLARCVPQLQLAALVVDFDVADFKVYSGCCDEGRVERVICKAEEQAGLADACVANQQHLDEVVVPCVGLCSHVACGAAWPTFFHSFSHNHPHLIRSITHPMQISHWPPHIILLPAAKGTGVVVGRRFWRPEGRLQLAAGDVGTGIRFCLFNS